MNLETLLCHREGFGLETATPVQRALCRASTGVALGSLALDPAVQAAFGGWRALDLLPKTQPPLFTLCAAVRTGKSLIEAARIYRMSQTVDCSRLGAGDQVRIPIVSYRMDQAQQVFDHLLGALMRSPRLATSLVGTPKKSSLFLRHPSGRPIEVRVVAGSRAGTTLVARWLAGCVFDEAPRLQGQADGIVNLDDALTAVQARMLPGASIDCVGSPWAPRGTVYQQYIDHFGKPSSDLLVAVATGPSMNPGRFTPEFCADLERRDPRAYKTDVLAQFADTEDSLLASVDVISCTRQTPDELLYIPAHNYSAAMDPGMRANAWGFIIVDCDRVGHYRVVLAKQWSGSNSRPLDPRGVLAEIAVLCQRFGIDAVRTDQHSYDSLWAIADGIGLSLLLSTLTSELWLTVSERLRTLIASHQLELPPDATLRSDLLGVHRRLTARSYSIALATTSGDKRHSDYVPALCLALLHLPEPPTVAEPDQDEESLFCEAMRNATSNFSQAAASRLTGASPWQ